MRAQSTLAGAALLSAGALLGWITAAGPETAIVSLDVWQSLKTGPAAKQFAFYVDSVGCRSGAPAKG
jgi:hypothetical protein